MTKKNDNDLLKFIILSEKSYIIACNTYIIIIKIIFELLFIYEVSYRRVVKSQNHYNYCYYRPRKWKCVITTRNILVLYYNPCYFIMNNQLHQPCRYRYIIILEKADGMFEIILRVTKKLNKLIFSSLS